MTSSAPTARAASTAPSSTRWGASRSSMRVLDADAARSRSRWPRRSAARGRRGPRAACARSESRRRRGRAGRRCSTASISALAGPARRGSGGRPVDREVAVERGQRAVAAAASAAAAGRRRWRGGGHYWGVTWTLPRRGAAPAVDLERDDERQCVAGGGGDAGADVGPARAPVTDAACRASGARRCRSRPLLEVIWTPPPWSGWP